MKQVKICIGLDRQDLEREINQFLDGIGDESPSITFEHPITERLTAVIEYEKKNKQLMCCDCQFYDSTKDVRNAFGLCQFGEGRVRFSNCICSNFKDLRG